MPPTEDYSVPKPAMTWETFQAAGLTWPLPEEMTDAAPTPRGVLTLEWRISERWATSSRNRGRLTRSRFGTGAATSAGRHTSAPFGLLREGLGCQLKFVGGVDP